jgi:MYXO-CTERM domain-containing protein
MKKALLTLAAVVAMGVSAFGQGTITFYNNGIARPFTTDAAGTRTYTYDPNVNGTQLPASGSGQTIKGNPLISADATTYRAGIFLPNGGSPGTAGAGAAYTAGLFLTSDLNTPLATTPFRGNNTFEVFANNVPVTITGQGTGATPNFTIRAWETGKTFATSTVRGEASFTSQPLGGPVAGNPDASPASLLGFNGFTMYTVPEPSTFALGALGLGALALIRRRK